MAQAPRQTNTAELAVIRQIVESVQASVKDIPEIQRNIAVMTTNFEQVRLDVAAHELTINGNGKPGIKDDVSHLKTRMKIITWAAGIIGASLLTFSTALWLYLIVVYGSQVF